MQAFSFSDVKRRVSSVLELGAVFGVVLIALIWTGVIFSLDDQENSAFLAAEQTTDNLTRVFAEHISTIIAQADKALKSVRTLHEKDSRNFDVDRARRDLEALNSQISIIDSSGFLHATTIQSVTGVPTNLGDREHFRVHQTAVNDELFISKTMARRSTNEGVIWLSRRLSKPDGSFDGVVVAAIDEPRLTHFYETINIGKDGIIAVTGLDGSVRAARGFKTADLGRSSPLLLEAIRNSPNGVFRANGRVDRIPRLVSYRKAGSLPLVVSVGVSENELLKDHKENRRNYYAAATALTLAILIVVVLMGLRRRSLIEWQSQAQLAQGAIVRANQELVAKQYAIDQAVIVAITDVKGDIIHANDAFCVISGYSREELLGKNHRILNSGNHAREFFQEMYRCIAKGEVWRGELCNKAKNGTLYWLETTIIPQLGPDGRPLSYTAIRVDVTERKQAEARISSIARHDFLTGLPNRSVFQEKLEEFLARVRRYQGTFAVLLLDLDGFKDVNDTLGHGAGDELLKQLGQRLSALIRETDVLARLGGDEFAILQCGEEDQREAAISLAVRILEIVSEPFDVDGHKVSVGASIGISLAPDDSAQAGELLQKADLALYRVKAEGRNNFRFFESEMSSGASERVLLLSDLREALIRKEFELFYQPIYDSKTCRPCGAEALVRWRHPVRGLLSPDQFIPLAESTGLIEPLGEWILEQACTDAASWPENIKVAINLSAVQFRSGKLFDVILCTLIETGLPPERLELEITETVLMQSAENNSIVMQQLKNTGISIALDDFGTGYSSLSYLTHFPFDKIKIDKSFTQGLSIRADSAAIVASIITLARGLDMIVTAEGVETEQQFELLRAAGAHQMQGYLFARPTPLAELNFATLEQKGQAVAASCCDTKRIALMPVGQRHPEDDNGKRTANISR